jgi:hypothetical protein
MGGGLGLRRDVRRNMGSIAWVRPGIQVRRRGEREGESARVCRFYEAMQIGDR